MAFAILVLIVAFTCVAHCKITSGPHLNGFADYVNSFNGPVRCQAAPDPAYWHCRFVVAATGQIIEMDVVSAAMLVRDQKRPPRHTNWPPNTAFKAVPGLREISGKKEPLNHLQFFPKTSTVIPILIQLIYYTEQNGQYIKNEKDFLHDSRVRPYKAILQESRQHYYLIHDFAETSFNPPMTNLLQSLTNMFEAGYNEDGWIAFVVDWSKGSQYNAEFDELMQDGVYDMAAANTITVGMQLAFFMDSVFRVAGKPKRPIMIGDGLGAQVAHFASEQVKRIGEEEISIIYGIDPAAYHFQGHEQQFVNSNHTTKPYLNINDAEKVVVWHTSAISGFKTNQADLIQGRFGTSFYSDGIDFYPHGGSSQPPCNNAVFNKLCNHNIALDYFVQGMQHGADPTTFISVKAQSYNDYVHHHTILAQTTSNVGYMSMDLMKNVKAGIYFNHYDGLPNMLARVPPFLLDGPVELQHAIITQHLRPSFFPRYDAEHIANQDSKLLLEHEDTSNCGMYIRPSPTSPTRVAHGSKSYQGAFPWSVCIVGRSKMRLPIDRVSSGVYESPDARKSKIFIVPRADFRKYKDGTYFRLNSFGPFDLTENMCTGSIIDEKHVLTAAHCFEGIANGQDLLLTMGGTSCANYVEAQRFIVEKRQDYSCSVDPGDITQTGTCQTNVFMYPEYSNEVDNNRKPDEEHPDIAVIRLPVALQFNLPWELGKDETTPFLNSICYKSSASFESLYHQHTPATYVYTAGYGLKAKQERGTVHGADLTWTKLRVGSGYPIQGGQYYIEYSEPEPGIFHLADDTIDPVTQKWAGRDALEGDSGAAIVWHIVHKKAVSKRYVGISKAVAVGIVRQGPDEGEHFTETVNVTFPNSEAITPGDGQQLASFSKNLLPWLRAVIAVSNLIPGNPPDFIPDNVDRAGL